MGDGGVACVYSLRFDTFYGESNENVKTMKKFSKGSKNNKKYFSLSSGGVENVDYDSEDELLVEDENDEKSAKNGFEDDEVEEGELGSWDEPRRFEIRSEIEKGEIITDRWRKGDNEFVSWKKRQSGEFSSGSGRRDYEVSDEVEKGEFIPDRWNRNEESSYVKTTKRYDSTNAKSNKGWKTGRNASSGKYSGEKNGSNQFTKKSNARWEGNNSRERTPRISSKIVDEEGQIKEDFSNGKNHGTGREFPLGNRLKRPNVHMDNSDRKHHAEFNEYTPYKSRRISDDGSRYNAEQSYKNSASARNVNSERYSSRNCESPVSSSRGYDRYNSNTSPRHVDRSPPRRQYDYRDHENRSPVRRERSPYGGRNRHYDNRNRSPSYSERSPHDQTRGYDRRERTPSYSERSPYEHARGYDRRERTPSYSERSPYEQARGYDRRERTPSYSERSPHYDRRERTPSYSERSPYEHARGYDRRERTPSLTPPPPPPPPPPNRGRSNNKKTGSSEKRKNHSKSQDEKVKSRETKIVSKESDIKIAVDACDVSVEKSSRETSQKEDIKQTQEVNGAAEELLSMEEDMDICDTPPHVPESETSVSTSGKWFYLDHLGVQQGPSRLSDLKMLVEEGFLVSDHFIKHLDSQRWVTVENAVSPVVTTNFSSSFVDAVTELVSPPEAPGNLLVEAGELVPASNQTDEEVLPVSVETNDDSEPKEDLQIDERVAALFDGFTSIPGKELETLAEVLQITFDNGELQRWGHSEGLTFHQCEVEDRVSLKMSDDLCGQTEFPFKEGADIMPSGPLHSDKDYSLESGDAADWFSGQWSCKGGDWKRIDDTAQDRFCKKKHVLNDGYPLCQMPKSGLEDPRRHQKDELYQPSHGKRLDLPFWAFNPLDESTEYRSNQSKNFGTRGVRGLMLPVTRINTCVVMDHGSFVSEPRVKSRGKERYSSRPSHRHGASSDSKRSSEESVSRRKSTHEPGHHDSCKSIVPIIMPKDHLATKDDLQLHLGDWYYLDGAGHERGPVSYSEMQVLADQGIIHKHSSVFRKFDRLWVPVTSTLEDTRKIENENSSDTSRVAVLETTDPIQTINEVLDPWINLRQPKKEMEKNIYNPAITNKFSRSDQASKIARFMADGVDGDYELEDDATPLDKEVCVFEDLCGDATFCREKSLDSVLEKENWGLLDGQADLSSASNCTDSMIHNIMSGYNKDKITSLVLRGCTKITASMLEEVLGLLPCLSSVDIRGCSQFEDLASKFPNIRWVKSRTSHSAMRNKQLAESSHVEDSSGLRDYFEKFLALGLKDIMRENTFEFFIPKVSDIEGKIRNGYYAGRGLGSVKDDIRRMCREAIKVKGKGDAKEMNHIINLFIRLATSLEDRSKFSIEKDAIMKNWKDDSPPGFNSSSLKSKKVNRERKYTSRNSGPFFNGNNEHGYYASDREIRKRLSKLNRKALDSGSDTSDDRKRLSKLNRKALDSGSDTSDDRSRSSEETETDSDSTSSDSNSDLDIRSASGQGESRGDGYVSQDDGFDSFVDDREWGARMTKASLVPPVTRKYELGDEVIEQEVYGIDPYTHNLLLDSMPEESDWHLLDKHVFIEDMLLRTLNKQVRAFTGTGNTPMKKQLGDEVIEQEVYGIDPYTHNLLLDSMPEESDWHLLDKHVFIEDMLLRTLNMQVRAFTSTGNTPMKYPLKPVVEDILKKAKLDH
nr:histone-lysine N-methyltransferase ATXR3 [Tanacetum cinerariifolium]